MFKTYSAQRVVITAEGVPLTGMGEDGFLKISPKSPRFETTVGADGAVVRSKSADRRVDIEIVLLASSPSNAHLQALFDTDSETGTMPFPLQIEDLGGRMVCSVAIAWVVAQPPGEFGKSEGSVTWKLEGASAVTALGGSLF